MKRDLAVGIVLKDQETLLKLSPFREVTRFNVPLTEQARGPPESPLQESVPPSKYPAHNMPSGKGFNVIVVLSSLP